METCEGFSLCSQSPQRCQPKQAVESSGAHVNKPLRRCDRPVGARRGSNQRQAEVTAHGMVQLARVSSACVVCNARAMSPPACLYEASGRAPQPAAAPCPLRDPSDASVSPVEQTASRTWSASSVRYCGKWIRYKKAQRQLPVHLEKGGLPEREQGTFGMDIVPCGDNHRLRQPASGVAGGRAAVDPSTDVPHGVSVVHCINLTTQQHLARLECAS